jgi:apolipoprotein D and lipocalin family protein
VVVAFSAAGCASHPPIRTAPSVDLDRFMGDWYVLAHIPAPLEREAFDAVESYARGGERRIETTYRFRNGGLDGPWEVHTPTGFVRDDPSNAHWGMQFIWPFRMEYRIVHVDPDYSQTIIGRSRRDYAWIMARDPRIPAAELEALKEILVEEGYDLTELRLVPHGSAGGEEEPRRVWAAQGSLAAEPRGAAAKVRPALAFVCARRPRLGRAPAAPGTELLRSSQSIRRTSAGGSLVGGSLGGAPECHTRKIRSRRQSPSPS